MLKQDKIQLKKFQKLKKLKTIIFHLKFKDLLSKMKKMNVTLLIIVMKYGKNKNLQTLKNKSKLVLCCKLEKRSNEIKKQKFLNQRLVELKIL